MISICSLEYCDIRSIKLLVLKRIEGVFALGGSMDPHEGDELSSRKSLACGSEYCGPIKWLEVSGLCGWCEMIYSRGISVNSTGTGISETCGMSHPFSSELGGSGLEFFRLSFLCILLSARPFILLSISSRVFGRSHLGSLSSSAFTAFVVESGL